MAWTSSFNVASTFLPRSSPGINSSSFSRGLPPIVTKLFARLTAPRLPPFVVMFMPFFSRASAGPALLTCKQVEGLKAQMCTALSKHLNHDDACSVFAAADSHHCGVLKQEAFSKIVQHFALATRSDGWLALNKGQLSEVSTDALCGAGMSSCCCLVVVSAGAGGDAVVVGGGVAVVVRWCL